MKGNSLKVLESELHEKNALINSTPDMIWAVDSEMRLVAFNESYKQVIEATQQKQLKRHDPVLVKDFGPELYNKWKAYYERALSGEHFSVIEHAEVSGKTMYGEISFHPILVEGKAIGVSCFNRDVTILKETQNKLLNEAERLRLAIAASNIGTFDFYPLEDKLVWNDRLYEIFDLKPDPALDLFDYFFQILHPDDKNKTKEAYDNFLTPNGPEYKQTEYRIEVGGKIKHILAHSRILRNDAGEVVRMLGTCQDITEIRENEHNLKKSKDLFRSIVEDQAEMIVRWKPDGIRTFVNKAYLDCYGLKEDEAMGTSFFDLISPKDQKRIKKEIKELTPENPTREKVHKVILPDGSTRWQRWRDRAFFNEKGKAVEYQSVGRDMTQIVEARQALEENEERYRNIFNQQFQFTALLDVEGRVVHINELPLKIQGLTREDYLGKYFWETPSWSGNKEWEKKIKNQVLLTRKTEEHFVVEDTYYGAGKETRYANASYSIIRNSKGLVENILVQAMDITNEKKAAEQIRKHEQQLSLIYDNTTDYILLLRCEKKGVIIEEMNESCAKLIEFFGIPLSKSELIGYSMRTIYHELLHFPEEKIKDRLKKFEYVKKHQQIVRYEQKLETPRGLLVTSVDFIPVVQGRKTTHLLMVAKDITKSYLAEEQVKASERQLSLIYNNSNDFMILVRVEQKGYYIESLNDATIAGLKQAGYSVDRNGLVGLNMRTYFEDILRYSQEEVRSNFGNYDKVKKSKEIVRYTTESYYNGQFFAIDTTATPIIESGKVKYILTVSRDITEIVQSKAKLQEAYTELEKLKSRVEQENIYLKEEIKQGSDFENMVFKSAAFRNVLNQIDQVAKTDATVLITGETGTGKELIARALHNTSNRSAKPMIKVNTAAIPKDLIESELFGHEKGAFTGATSEKPGKFELADGGSIFLDEIGDMPPELQVKILRVLQEGEVERLGSTKVTKIDARVIAATNKDLRQAVQDGNFREDLLYRINVFPIEIPPLRTRPLDIPILVEHFISKYSQKHHKNIMSIPKKSMDYLRTHTWPGNVRELENTIERAVILSIGETLTIPEVVRSSTISEEWTHDNALDIVQENHIRHILTECHWKVEGDDGAAAQLKIKPSTLRDKMKKFNIKRPKS